MKITEEIKRAVQQKIWRMPLGTYSRLKLENQISDIVIQTVSSGVYFFNVSGTIGEDILEKIIGFKFYSELE